MITLQNVSKVFGTGVAGLSDINLQIDKGEFVFLVGHTGSGKTTLLRMLIKEVTPTTGNVIVGGWDLNKLPGHKIPHLRKKIGVIFQDLKLLMDRTIFENIMLPLQVSGVNGTEAQNRAEELLEHVGISMHRDKFPIQLSGGELQRAAIARALTLSPDILLADEPTGNLDAATAFGIVSLLSKINQHGTTIIMATHNMEIVEKLGNRVVVLEKGLLLKDEKGKNSKITTESTLDKKESKEPEKTKEKEEQKTHEEHKKQAHHAKTATESKQAVDKEKKEAEDTKESAKISPKEGDETEKISASEKTETIDELEKPKKKKFSFFNRKKE
ncbi:MAG TPA: ATP-binding cassette domain-containing protein [Candidatus Saccharimonadales bacterium]|nr:ATP-binding cassette domain-containing protein [Candidatus Saccharimonadales bacterium]